MACSARKATNEAGQLMHKQRPFLVEALTAIGLIVAPFVPFFAGLVSFRKLRWLRVVAAIGLLMALAMSAFAVEDIAVSSTLGWLVSYTFVGSLILSGIGLFVAFVGLSQSARTHTRAGG